MMKQIVSYNENILRQLSGVALVGATYNNNMDLVNKLIRENRATPISNGLLGAALGGKISTIRYLIALGADNYNDGFSLAIASGNINAADYIWNLEKFEINQTNVSFLLKYKNKAAFRYIKEIGFDDWDRAINLARETTPFMVKIIEEVRDEIE